jgi:hypothetical protein
MKILVLVIVSFNKPVYYDMLRVWREQILSNDCADGCVVDVWFIQCKSDAEWIGDIVNDIGERSIQQSLRPMTPPLYEKSKQTQSEADRFELDRENKTLYVKGDECLIPGILHKTVEALSYFLSFDYDFVWRTNLSSVLDFEGLQRYLGTINSSGFYGGYVGKALSGATVSGATVSGATVSGATVSKDIFFASGAGFLMSRDVAEYLVLNKDFLRWDLIDDVAIGALLEPKFGIVPIERCWIQSGEEMVGSNGIFHYRCESYQHLRTVEFMQYVVRGLGK